MDNTDYKKFFKRNKSFCPKAFKEIYVDNAGRYRLCCHARPTKSLKRFEEDKTLPFDWFLSDEMEEIRQKMFEGEMIPECNACYQIEEASGESYRFKAFEHHGFNSKSNPFSTEINKVTIKVRYLGSYCNLSCYMCHPYNSTTRKQELEKIFPAENVVDQERFIRGELDQVASVNVKYSDWNKYVDHIIDNIHLIGKFQMMGGETLQLPKYWDLLEQVPEEHAKNITVGQSTNLTEIRYKNKSLLDLAEKLKYFHLGVSVDHYLDKLSFMRYPIDVEQFEKNLAEICEYDPKIEFKLDVTVSLLNINDLFEIKKYYTNKFNLKPYGPTRSRLDFDNIVRGPKYLSIRNLPDRLKQKYIDIYSEQFPYVIAELVRDPVKPLDDFFAYCDKLSLYRNLDWRPIWKDFIDVLHE